jgi:hypothetical protein
MMHTARSSPILRIRTALIVLAVLAASPAYATLLFNVTYGSSLNSLSNAAAIKTTISNVLGIYSADFSDNITVAIQFDDMGSGLGQSSTFFGNLSYPVLCVALKAGGTTANDTTANASIPACGATNPVNSNSTINVKTANARALGIALNPPGGNPDGTVSINFASRLRAMALVAARTVPRRCLSMRSTQCWD